MIEVEIRGRLTKRGYESLKRTLKRKGKFLRHLEREMYLLRDYPGYSKSFVHRNMDVRLRNTNGQCELMIKRKAAHKNTGREEVSLEFKDGNLGTAMRAMRALGFKKALKMVRTMDVYRYRGIEWQIVKTPKGLWYWEAELAAKRKDEVKKAHARLIREARNLNLKIMTPKELQEFIDVLDKKVNVEVNL